MFSNDFIKIHIIIIKYFLKDGNSYYIMRIRIDKCFVKIIY